MINRRVITAVAAVCLVAGPAAYAQTAPSAQLLPDLGSYSYPIRTTNPTAQRFFDQGLVLLYNFNHEEAEKSFLEAARLESCRADAVVGRGHRARPELQP